MSNPDIMRNDVLSGLAGDVKTIPCKYFYDERGAELFEQICTLDEYYATRTELEILETHAAEIAQRLGPGCRVIEYGSGSGTKIRILLDALDSPVAFTPIDISCEQLYDASTELADLYPAIDVQPICADYTRQVDLPAVPDAARTVIFFPGSTIGNFEPAEAQSFLQRAARHAGADGAMVIGVDRRKDRGTLERAYNDSDGVTAEFNLNLLARLNRDIGTDFDISAFHHRAVWNDGAGRIEMRLVSDRDQTVSVPDGSGGTAEVAFHEGEWIVTEHSHKYEPAEFAALARDAGWQLEHAYSDAQELFSVLLMRSRV